MNNLETAFRTIDPGMIANPILKIRVGLGRFSPEVQLPAVASQVFDVEFDPDMTEASISEPFSKDQEAPVRFKRIKSSNSIRIFSYDCHVVPDEKYLNLDYQGSVSGTKLYLDIIGRYLSLSDYEQMKSVFIEILVRSVEMPYIDGSISCNRPFLRLRIPSDFARFLGFAVGEDYLTLAQRELR